MVGRGHGYRRCEEHVWHGKWAAPKVEKIICGRLLHINEYMANIGLCIYPIVSNYTRMLCLCQSAVTLHTIHSGIIVECAKHHCCTSGSLHGVYLVGVR